MSAAKIASAVALLTNGGGGGGVPSKSALESELSACRERVSKLETVIEDMMFDEIDATVARVLTLTHDLLTALAACGHAAAGSTAKADALALQERALRLIRSGEQISENPDDDAATNVFVELSELVPKELAALLGSIERAFPTVVAPTPTPAPTPVPTPAPVCDSGGSCGFSCACDQRRRRRRSACAQSEAARGASGGGSSVVDVRRHE
jgi:hypothetical protein